MEDRDDLSEVLLRGLPPEERDHVINVIKQSDAEKLRELREEQPPQQRDGEAADETADKADDNGDDERDDDQEMAGA